jgi:hypothetical protein
MIQWEIIRPERRSWLIRSAVEVDRILGTIFPSVSYCDRILHFCARDVYIFSINGGTISWNEN